MSQKGQVMAIVNQKGVLAKLSLLRTWEPGSACRGRPCLW